MRHRTIGLAAAVLLAAPVVASCTRPPGGGPGPTRPPTGGGIPGPAAGQQDCGTITAGTTNNTASSCFLGYHGFAAKYLKIVKGDETIVLSASGHKVTVTRATNGVVTKSTLCEGLPNSQFTVTASGNISSSCPF